MSNDLPHVIAEIVESEKQAARGELDRLDLGKATGPGRYDIEFTYDPHDRDTGPIARFGSDVPLPIPVVGQTVHVHGHGPLTVRKVDIGYEINEEHGGLYVEATVDVAVPSGG
ncbi:hypothetical protein [Streptomyces gobiensis]|uniref:hypothetical protein n=1 Tax=Streptomyces gobiensis TaxID=2875706 RepID=UPI001E4F8044|nr:hypothetical protein [Streptomyces gobiensis]UGY91954.1 hypothetical protein test1122_09625 [Streptomyces gobiensis]